MLQQSMSPSTVEHMGDFYLHFMISQIICHKYVLQLRKTLFYLSCFKHFVQVRENYNFP